MKIELIKIVEFNNFLKSIEEKKLSLKLAYSLYSIYESINKDVEFYYTKLQEIISEYAEKNEDGTYRMSEDGSQIILIPDKIEECNTKLTELAACEIEKDIPKLSFAELSQIEGVEISLNELATIKPFLSE